MQHNECKAEELFNEGEHSDVHTAEDSLSSGSSATLLSVLDDKNKAIENLQQQLKNQKLQLAYYIKNSLKSSKIMQLSRTCEPDTVDNNISLTLALSNFCKQTGMKSRLMNLYQRMATADERIQKIIGQQEYLLKEIVDKFFFFNKQHFDMLNDIFHATVDLQSELDRYRLCCNRLISTEDERNTLVEQVYSLSAEERTHCNYFMAVEIERSLLEKEMKDIRCEQIQLQKQLQQLKIIEKGLRETQMKGDCYSDSFGTQLMEMLESVKTDALALLTISTSQKCRYNTELTELAVQNKTLQQELENLQKLMSEEVKNNSTKDLEEKICEKDKVIGELQLQLKIKTDENESLLQTVDKLRSDIHELETTRVNLEDVESLQTERDNYKSQVEDLEAIRRAYSQLVEHHPDIEAELIAKEKQTKELEECCKSMIFETKKLKEVNSLHKSHIKNLLIVIDKFAECKNDTITSENSDSETQYNADECKTILQALELDSKEHNLTSCNTKNLLVQSQQDCNNQTVTTTKHADTVVDNTDNVALANKISCGVATSSSNHTSQRDVPVPVLAKTTFKVERTDTNGKVETVKAVLESTSSIQGIIHLKNATNNMSVDVHCKKPKYTNPNVAIMDENELMKDCSKETVPNICSPYQYYNSCLLEEIIEHSRSKTDVFEIGKEEECELLDDNENEYFDVIEYKTPPHSQQDRGSCWMDSSSSSVEVCAFANCEDSKISTLMLENIEEKEQTENVKEQEKAINQLVNMNKTLKLISSRIDSILRIPAGKASIIRTLQEMYKSLFCKNNV